MSTAAPLLQVEEIHTAYGLSRVLFGVSLEIRPGECVCLLGRNGVGKSTTMRSIMGLTPPQTGRVRWKGTDITGWEPYRVARAGLGFVPEDRRIFADLTVWENLDVATRSGQWTTERVFDLFPKLRELAGRNGGYLSGGEQQMLTIARALMTNPALLLLDEPLEGLAPIIVEELTAAIGHMTADEGTAFILVEQHAEVALSLTDEAVVIERGSIVHRARSQDLLADQATLDRLIGLRLDEQPGGPAASVPGMRRP
jgi:branched-chain amino acid transport system ATP-binding protein